MSTPSATTEVRIAPRRPSFIEQMIVVPQRVRNELPDNDTFSVYYDLLAGRIPKHATIKEMAHVCRLSPTTFYKVIDTLVEMGYVTRTEKIVPGRVKPFIELELQDVDIQAAPSATPTPATVSVPLFAPSAPPKTSMISCESGDDVWALWGANPVKAVHALIDDVHGWNNSTVSPATYKRESRDGKAIAQQYSPQYVRQRLMSLLATEPMWKQRRISTTILLSKLPQRKDNAHDPATSANGHQPSHAYASLADYASVPASPGSPE